jgi:hypothetical protein
MPPVPAAESADEPSADPGGAQAAVNRYRDLAKYLVTIFAAIGALLAAGTQLSSLGQLSVTDDTARLVAAAIALAVAIGVVVVVVQWALGVLQPVEMTLDKIIATPAIREEIEKRPSLLLQTGSVQALKAAAAEALADEPDEIFTAEDQARWRAGINEVLDEASVVSVQQAFMAAWRKMLKAGIVGAVAIALFAWAANPPADDASASAVVSPAPVLVKVTLTSAGREALKNALGQQCTERSSIRALSIGGSDGAPKLVTIPEDTCGAAQFTLEPGLGYAASTTTAPRPKPSPTPSK